MSKEPVTHTEWLGRIVLAASGIELHARGIAAMLVDPVEPEIGPIVLRRLGNSYASLVQFAVQLAPVRLTETSPAHHLLDPITSWLKDTTDFMEQRNACLHAVWMIGDHPEATRLSLRSMEADTISVETLGKIANRGAHLHSTGGDLWEKLIYCYGHLDALIEATERAEREGFDAVFGKGADQGDSNG